jgi:hypothetical protein
MNTDTEKIFHFFGFLSWSLGFLVLAPGLVLRLSRALFVSSERESPSTMYRPTKGVSCGTESEKVLQTVRFFAVAASLADEHEGYGDREICDGKIGYDYRQLGLPGRCDLEWSLTLDHARRAEDSLALPGGALGVERLVLGPAFRYAIPLYSIGLGSQTV